MRRGTDSDARLTASRVTTVVADALAHPALVDQRYCLGAHSDRDVVTSAIIWARQLICGTGVNVR